MELLQDILKQFTFSVVYLEMQKKPQGPLDVINELSRLFNKYKRPEKKTNMITGKKEGLKVDGVYDPNSKEIYDQLQKALKTK